MSVPPWFSVAGSEVLPLQPSRMVSGDGFSGTLKRHMPYSHGRGFFHRDLEP